jgi:hypothetical protein
MTGRDRLSLAFLEPFVDNDLFAVLYGVGPELVPYYEDSDAFLAEEAPLDSGPF